MKKKNKITEYDYIEMYEVSEEEYSRAVEEYERKYEKKYKRINGIKSFFACMFFSPLEIVFKLLSIVSKLIAVISSVAFPYGVYLAYQTYKEIQNDVRFTMTENGKNALMWILLPFVAFAIFYICDKLSEWFGLHK